MSKANSFTAIEPMTQTIEPDGNKAVQYDAEAEKAGWDSPERAQRLTKPFIGDGSVILDIGIGTGQAVRGYAEKGATIIGLDRDPGMLAAAQSVTGESGSMRQANINDPLPLADVAGRIDVAQAIGVLEFAKDLGSIVDQVKMALKPDGVFVFTVEIVASNDDKLIQHYPGADLTLYRHDPDAVRKLLDEREFSVLYDEAYDGYERGDTASGKVPYHIFLAQLT